MGREFPILGINEAEIRDLYTIAARLDERHKAALRESPNFAFFVGYPRSAHSLIGAVIDAHPDAVCAQELDVIKFLQAGFDHRRIKVLLIENARLAGEAGRLWGPYSYAIPNQWQGRCRRLRILADKKGGTTTQRLAHDPALLDRLLETFGEKTKVIHVVRNPFDVVATNRRKQFDDCEAMTRLFFEQAATNAWVRERLGPSSVIDLYHEETLAKPKEAFDRLFGHLQLASEEGLVEDCAALVEPPGFLSRHAVPWTENAKAEIMRQSERFNFLAHYRFEDA